MPDSNLAPLPAEATSTAPAKKSGGSKVPLTLSLLLNLLLIVGLVGGGVGGYVLYSKAQTQAAQLQVENQALEAENLNLADAVAEGGADSSVDEECLDQIIDIRVGTYTIPCGWHSYFEIRLTEELSTGSVSDDPIYLLGASDAPVGKVAIVLNRYSTDLGNYTANPIVAAIASEEAFGAVVTDVTSSTGLEFKKVVNEEVFPSIAYYTQTIIDGDAYLIAFSTRQETDLAFDVMDTFEWTP
jgi:hypothetical protein